MANKGRKEKLETLSLTRNDLNIFTNCRSPENSLHVKRDRAGWIGDLVDIALKAADERHEIEVLMREALLANDDIQLKVHARRLVGLE
jgi:hypothetical protein